MGIRPFVSNNQRLCLAELRVLFLFIGHEREPPRETFSIISKDGNEALART